MTLLLSSLTLAGCEKKKASSDAPSASGVGAQTSSEVSRPEVQTKEGVQHCALMYPIENRNTEAMKPYVARMRNYKPTGEWLFDTFLFLRLITTSGVKADTAKVNMEDWRGCLDRFFQTGQDLFSLEEAIEQLKRTLGEPPSKRKVIIGIPYPHKDTKNFGDVDGDGKEEDFSKLQDRRKVLDWYIQDAINRFNKQNFKNIELWGFYWIEEGLDDDKEIVSAARDLIHDAGYKFMWIPYYQAPNYKEADAYFDLTIMQPNYAFNSWTDDGAVRADRLEQTARECKELDFGIEMEYRSSSPYDVATFQRYLAYGAADRLGYQFGVNGYYLYADFVETTYMSGKPEHKAIYEMLCDYVTGVKVPDPDVHVTDFSYEGNTITFPAGTADRISYVDVLVDTEKLGKWKGTLAAEFGRGGTWKPGGWMSTPMEYPGRYSVLTIPTEGTAETIRLTVNSWEGSLTREAIQYISVDHTGPRTETNFCLNKTYTLTPDTVERNYSDNAAGNRLIDGSINGEVVGWWHNSVQLIVDLGKETAVDSLELYFPSGGGGVDLPAYSVAMLSSDQYAGQVLNGTGALPGNLRIAGGGAAQSTGENASGLPVSRITCTTGRAMTRFISVWIQPVAQRWMMLSELKVKNGGESVPVAGYRLLTLPTSMGNPYRDTGKQMTNGIESPGLNNGVALWDSKEGERTLTVDLERHESLKTITVHSLGGGLNDIYAAKRMVFYTSEDGKTWKEQKTVQKDSLVQTGSRNFDVPFKAQLSEAVTARYVRVVVTPGQGRCGLSEITAN